MLLFPLFEMRMTLLCPLLSHYCCVRFDAIDSPGHLRERSFRSDEKSDALAERYEPKRFRETTKGLEKRRISCSISVTPFRRQVLVGLNKGETLHWMVCDVFFGHEGRFTDRALGAALK
jgi:hypothetical protein